MLRQSVSYLRALALACGATLALASTASAVYIEGAISFDGVVRATQSGDIVNVDFQSATVLDAEGDFHAELDGEPTTSTFKDFSFNESTLEIVSGSVVPLWTYTFPAVGGAVYSFALTSISEGYLNTSPLKDLRVVGSGMLSISGGDGEFEDTYGNFILTGSGGTSRFSFDAGAVSSGTGGPGTSVPDAGSTMALLSFGLGGVALVRRKFAL